MKQRYFSLFVGICVTVLCSNLQAALKLPAVKSGVLRIWLKADAGVVKDNNGRVETWIDQSGNGNHAFQPVLANRPIFSPNAVPTSGRPVIRFNGDLNGNVGQFLHGTNDVGIRNAGTSFVVYARRDDDVPTDRILLMLGNPRIHFTRGYYVRNKQMAFFNSYDDYFTGFEIPADTYRVWSMQMNTNETVVDSYDFDGTNQQHFVDGISGAGAPDAGYYVGGLGPDGGVGEWTRNFNGDIAEVIYYRGRLSDEDRQAVEAYLTQKYFVASLPVILEQPQSQTVAVGSNVTFTISADGTPTPTYQWQFKGHNLPGQTGSSLTLENVRAANAGNYRVIVANANGRVASDLATLKTIFPVVIQTAPQDQVLNVNAALSFSVSATGTGLHYQWLSNGKEIAGATKAGLRINHVGINDAGIYTVSVTNVLSSASAQAKLTVTNSAFDFNEDGNTDLLLRNKSGAFMTWLMRQTNLQKSVTLGGGMPIDPSLTFVDFNDFIGDGEKNIVLQRTNGAVVILPGMHTGLLPVYPLAGPVTSDWKLCAIADFNGDGHGDFLAQNIDGTVAVWFLNGTHGTNFVDTAPTAINGTNMLNSKIVGTGDFNSDGQPDILWQGEDGSLSVWVMDGTNYVANVSVSGATVSETWRAAAIADFNSDGQADILFENDRGQMMVWLMNGTTVTKTISLHGGKAVNPAWQVVGPR